MTIQANAPIYAGAIVDPTSINQILSQVLINGMSNAGTVNFQASSAASNTITNLGSALFQYTVGSAMTQTIDSAYNIGLTLPGPLVIGQKFTYMVMTNASTTIATPTLSDTAVTLAGTTSCVAAGLRWYQGQITQATTTVGMQTTTGTTFTSIAQVGSTNNFTVTLGTNTIVPTVGMLINLSSITGTLAAGWYPINKVTSATSFVVALPPGTVWTATAATVGSSVVAPATYSPLITITGLMSTVLNIMAV